MVPHLDSNIRIAPSNATTIIEVKESHSMNTQGSHHSSLSSSPSSTSSSSSHCSCGGCTSDDKMSLELLQKKYEDMRMKLNESHKRIADLQKSLEVNISLRKLFIANLFTFQFSFRRSKAAVWIKIAYKIA